MRGELDPEARQQALSILDDDLLALYREPSGDYWVIIRDETDLVGVRHAWQVLQAQDKEAFSRGPAVLTPADFPAYRLLFHYRLQGLLAHSELVAGDDWLAEQDLAAPDPKLALGQIAADLLRCSSLLATPSKDGELEHRLFRLQNSLGLSPETEPVAALASAHAYLAGREEELPEFAWQGESPQDDPPEHLPELLSLVELDHHLVIVMPRVDAELLQQIDWPAVAGLVSDEFARIMLASPWQLRLVAAVSRAVDKFLLSFDRVWGVDLLTDCNPDNRAVRSSAAALPAKMLVERCPADYCAVAEADLPMLVHDLQNVQLNIQLRQEVLARRLGGNSQQPPTILPGREAPVDERVAANRDHFRWWMQFLIDYPDEE